MRRNRARTITLVGLMVGVGALSIGGAIGALFDNAQVKTSTTTSSTAPTTTLPPVANLGDVGKELGRLAEEGRHVDYAAVYGVTDPALPEGLLQSVELWRKGTMFRSDIVERTGSGTTRNTVITGGAVVRTCQTVKGVQSCKTVTDAPKDLPDNFIARIVTAKKPPKLTVRDAAVAGYEARCFDVTGIDDVDKTPKAQRGKGELCLAGDGTMLRLILRGATVELTHIDSDVPDSAFKTAG
jgi:hypothetical protein